MKYLNIHLKTHSDYKPHVCKICNKPFSLPTSLVKHMRTHGGEKKHLCTTCGKRFYEPAHLAVNKTRKCYCCFFFVIIQLF